jgi:hypothetical protein
MYWHGPKIKPYKKKRSGHRHTQEKKDLVKAQGEGGHLQVKEIGLRRNQPANILILDFQPPDL